MLEQGTRTYSVPTFPAPGVRIRRTLEIDTAVEEQRRAFKAKFGRDMREGDPLLFDPEADEPRPLPQEQIQEAWHTLCDILIQAGVDPAAVYAARKLGRIPTGASLKRMSPEESEEWQKLVAEYRAQREQEEAL